jgi:delta 1-pyrroline-5-carboxylate dehydrogenase
VLQRAADLLDARLPDYVALLAVEAHKSLPDGVAEVREAVDFCRYYAQLAETRLAEQELPGPTGERNVLRMSGRGVFVCISPWNFPLAIFAGQVVAALVCGNSVAAKPAEQTPAVARAFVNLLHEAGLPPDTIALLHGPGESIGAALVAHPAVAGVCFTGSTAVAKHIQRALAAKDGPIVPLIAETGGINAMLVDSTALPEQVVDAVVQSAFRSAGQRCSALRLLCLPKSTADAVLTMLAGAMAELRLGDPADLATDVGPLIDAEAWANVNREVQRLHGSARLVAQTPWPAGLHGQPQPEAKEKSTTQGGTHGSADAAVLAGDTFAPPRHWLAPVAFELATIDELTRETFGPVLHVLRWGPGCPGLEDADTVVARINTLGYGLTFGLHTRIDSRAERLARAARVGNVYVNRNLVGAVVGVQPFGGEGLSGTGPKAGGPHYLYRFCTEQCVSTNTAAAGGNVALLMAGG